jgi:plastocyanin
MPFRLGLSAAIVAILATAPATARAADATVTAREGPNRFDPPTVTVNPGNSVTWTNAAGLHNVVFDDGSFQMPTNPMNPPWTVSRTFGAVGSSSYVCAQHASMTGTVVVEAASTPPGGNPPPGSPGQPIPPGGQPGPGPGEPGPGGKDELSVTLKVSDATPLAGRRVRVFGVVSPARDGRKVQIQKRLRNGRYKTIATARLRDAGTSRSVYSLRLKLSADTVLRARVAGDADTATSLSRTRKLDVHRPA